MEIQKKARPSASTNPQITAIPCQFLRITRRLPWQAGIRDLCLRPPPRSGKVLSVSSSPLTGLKTSGAAPDTRLGPGRSPHEPQRLCPPPLRALPPGPDLPHPQPLRQEAPWSPGSPQPVPWTP